MDTRTAISRLRRADIVFDIDGPNIRLRLDTGSAVTRYDITNLVFDDASPNIRLRLDTGSTVKWYDLTLDTLAAFLAARGL